MSGSPPVWVSRLRTVMASRPSPVNAGKYFVTVSSSDSLPSSTRLITTAPVMGLEIEASRNTGSGPLAVPKLRAKV